MLPLLDTQISNLARWSHRDDEDDGRLMPGLMAFAMFVAVQMLRKSGRPIGDVFDDIEEMFEIPAATLQWHWERWDKVDQDEAFWEEQRGNYDHPSLLDDPWAFMKFREFVAENSDVRGRPNLTIDRALEWVNDTLLPLAAKRDEAHGLLKAKAAALRERVEEGKEPVEEKDDDHDVQRRARVDGAVGRTTVASWFERIGYKYYRCPTTQIHHSSVGL
jgi:hypothetical protein